VPSSPEEADAPAEPELPRGRWRAPNIEEMVAAESEPEEPDWGREDSEHAPEKVSAAEGAEHAPNKKSAAEGAEHAPEKEPSAENVEPAPEGVPEGDSDNEPLLRAASPSGAGSEKGEPVQVTARVRQGNLTHKVVLAAGSNVALLKTRLEELITQRPKKMAGNWVKERFMIFEMAGGWLELENDHVLSVDCHLVVKLQTTANLKLALDAKSAGRRRRFQLLRQGRRRPRRRRWFLLLRQVRRRRQRVGGPRRTWRIRRGSTGSCGSCQTATSRTRTSTRTPCS
jgi:hypothetical protein